MSNEFKTRVQLALEAGATLDELRELLRSAAASGLSREHARALLERMRSRAATEAIEDRILELLDIVTDHCSPQLRIRWIQ